MKDRTGRILSMTAVILTATISAASAQSLPWPTDAPATRPSAPWPATAAAPAAPPPAAAPSPFPAAPAPMVAPPPMAAPSPQPGFGNQPPPCVAEFMKLRDETQKRAEILKAAGERKPSREEMCKQIQGYAAVEGKWAKYAKDHVANCGIPKEIVQQIQTAHARTLAARKNVCSGGPQPGVAAAPATPSLSDALGTSRLPVPDTAKTGRGTLDTLTGNAIAR